MLCPSCNGFRSDNNAPCPFCNAPSPLLAQVQAGQSPVPAGGENSFWSQSMTLREKQKTGEQPSLLPVPYQNQAQAGNQALSLLSTGFPTINAGVQQVNPLLPSLPDADQEAPVYVPPMYTKPRPIIPRYRAISGLLSVIIVFTLLCAGAGYYAQVTGKLTFFEKLLGIYTPPSITSNQNKLPVPSNKVVYSNNPAAKIIDSVGISTSVNNNGLIPAMVNQFTVGQTIYLVCGANVPKDPGVITVKWYANNNFYKLSTADAKKTNQSVAAIFNIVYGLPTEGKAEVYWNNQLAATVLFVVEPAA